jgi:hypothetical protein
VGVNQLPRMEAHSVNGRNPDFSPCSRGSVHPGTPNYEAVPSDNHVFEPPDLWTSRAKPGFKDRIPQLVREYDGDWWYCDGHRVIGLSPGAQTGMRFEAPEKMVRTTTFDRVRRGGYVPEEHLKDMDADGVDVSIV